KFRVVPINGILALLERILLSVLAFMRGWAVIPAKKQEVRIQISAPRFRVPGRGEKRARLSILPVPERLAFSPRRAGRNGESVKGWRRLSNGIRGLAHLMTRCVK